MEGKMPRIAYFETGRAHDKSINELGMSIERIPICKVRRLNLMKYDLVIIPSFYNQDVLSKIQKRLI